MIGGVGLLWLLILYPPNITWLAAGAAVGVLQIVWLFARYPIAWVFPPETWRDVLPIYALAGIIGATVYGGGCWLLNLALTNTGAFK